MKFHITITNNETGETLIDAHTNAVLASFTEEDGTSEIISIECNALELGATIAGLLHIVQQMKQQYPVLFKLAKKAAKKNKN